MEVETINSISGGAHSFPHPSGPTIMNGCLLLLCSHGWNMSRFRCTSGVRTRGTAESVPVPGPPVRSVSERLSGTWGGGGSGAERGGGGREVITLGQAWAGQLLLYLQLVGGQPSRAAVVEGVQEPPGVWRSLMEHVKHLWVGGRGRGSVSHAGKQEAVCTCPLLPLQISPVWGLANFHQDPSQVHRQTPPYWPHPPSGTDHSWPHPLASYRPPDLQSSSPSPGLGRNSPQSSPPGGLLGTAPLAGGAGISRSEERGGGKEWRSGWWPDH